MIKNFSAQNFEGQYYVALDLNESGALMYYAKNGDISLLKRFIQLTWASTAEDGIGINLTLNSLDHKLISTQDNTYFDDEVVRINKMEKKYGIKYSDYSKLFVITYTQLLNLELARVSPLKYLNQYVFFKADSKSYYSHLEDIYYDIEQAKKFSTNFDSSESELNESSNEINDVITETDINSQKLKNLQDKINYLENSKNEVNTDSISNTSNTSTIAQNIDEKISILENLLNNQKTQDSLIIQKQDLEKDIVSLSARVSQYEQSLSKLSKVDLDMNKYRNFTQINVERVENDLATFSYRLREREKILSDLGNRKITYEDTSSHIALLPLFVLVTIGISIAITLAVIQNIFFGFSIGIVVVIAAFLYFILSKDEKNVSENHITQDKIYALSNEVDALKSAKNRYLQNLGFNNEDDYFATKALVRAIAFQKENDLAKIHEQFEGKEISDFKYLIQDKKNTILNLQIEIDKFGPIMTPEEYLKKRRDLDMLKLEKSQISKTVNTFSDSSVNISTNTSSPKNIEKQIEDLKLELQELMNDNTFNSTNSNPSTSLTKEPIDLYKEILNEYYKREVNVNQDYSLKDFEISNYDQKVEILILQRLAYIKSNYTKVELPLILEDPFVGVDNKDLIKNILNFCVSHIQTIVVTEHEEYKELGFKVIN